VSGRIGSLKVMDFSRPLGARLCEGSTKVDEGTRKAQWLRESHQIDDLRHSMSCRLLPWEFWLGKTGLTVLHAVTKRELGFKAQNLLGLGYIKGFLKLKKLQGGWRDRRFHLEQT